MYDSKRDMTRKNRTKARGWTKGKLPRQRNILQTHAFHATWNSPCIATGVEYTEVTDHWPCCKFTIDTINTHTDTLLALEHHGLHSLHSLLARSMRASSYKATCVLFWWLWGGDFTRSQTGAGAAGQWEARARRLRPISCSQSAAGRVIEACCSRDRRLIVTSPRPLRQLRHRYWSARRHLTSVQPCPCRCRCCWQRNQAEAQICSATCVSTLSERFHCSETVLKCQIF